MMQCNFRIAAAAAVLLTSGCAFLNPPQPAPPPAPVEPDAQPMQHAEVTDPRAELLWDTYGVPHIFADDPAALFYAFGRAQMHSHGDLILRLYGQARGRAAEYWGESFVDSDVWVRTNDVPGRAERWLALQAPHIRAYIDSFVAGMNAYATQHPDALNAAVRQVLPIEPTDVLAHQQRVLNFTFQANPNAVTGLRRQWQAQPGSNAWAIGPARSTSGNALLVANPHLPWGDLFTWYEAQLVTPDMNAYGAALVGMPMLAIAFNDHLGWTHTINTIDGADVYELAVQDRGYWWDGSIRDFETDDTVILVRQPDGSLTQRPLPIRRSLHGPVIAERPGRALALRVAGLDAHALFQQYWDMASATDIGMFEAALSRLQLPMFTVMYADRQGNVLHVFNGTVPVRPHGDWDYWQGIVPGDTSGTLWNGVHAYHELPRVLNPGGGWLQNANDPPWTTTLPFALNARYFPPYMAPERPMAFRPQRSARMLAEDNRITWDELLTYKQSTRMEAADHLVQDVVAAARRVGDEHARAAADVLEQWDRTADADSRGSVLFTEYYRAMQRQRWPTGSMFEIGWTATAPLATPDGLSDPRLAAAILSQTAQRVRERFGALDVRWGDVYRVSRDGIELPASGGPGDLGTFRVLDFTASPDSTRFTATGGESWVAVIEFGSPVRAHALLGYGNASQPGSPHRTDQLVLFAGKQLRPVWRTREEVMMNLLSREVF